VLELMHLDEAVERNGKQANKHVSCDFMLLSLPVTVVCINLFYCLCIFGTVYVL